MTKQEKDFSDLSQKLLTTTDGSEYHELVRKIVKKYGEKMRQETLQTLVRAVKESKITHARELCNRTYLGTCNRKRHCARTFLLRNDIQRLTLLGF